jgi:hypothetical protein
MHGAVWSVDTPCTGHSMITSRQCYVLSRLREFFAEPSRPELSYPAVDNEARTISRFWSPVRVIDAKKY